MPRMSPLQVEEYLQLPHVAVLSVSRRNRGPVAVPVWYGFRDGVFEIVTSRDSVHGRAMERTGRATLTMRSENYGALRTVEQYAHVEGPIRFVDGDKRAVVAEMRRRYYRGENAAAWILRPLVLTQEIAHLQPERIAGFYWEESI